MGFRALILASTLLAGAALAEGEAVLSSCRWEGMARRRGGSLPWKPRWEAGTLAIRDDKVVWSDAHDPGKNVIVPISRLTAHFLSCREAEGRGCFEWGFRTKREEFRFRDLFTSPSGSYRLVEIRDRVGEILPGLPASVCAPYPR